MSLVSTHKKELDKKELSGIFSRYLEKKASPEEIRVILEHFRLEKDSALLKELIMAELNQPLEESNIISLPERETLERVKSELHKKFDQGDNHPTIVPLWRKKFIRLAAPIAAVLLVICGYIIWDLQKPVPTITAHAEYGKMQAIQLPDGSKVWLNAGTAISFPKEFYGKTRTVMLTEGQAYFDVAHDSDHPFIVTTREGNVTVLGTSFDVNAYGKDSEEKVTVRSGKVGFTVGHGQGTAFILPGERIIVNKADHRLRKTKVPLEDIAAWREQRLLFDDQPLSEVMRSLERKYNVTIKIDNQHLDTQKISMHLNNQPLTDVLTAISFSSHLSFKVINEKLIVIR